jgi:vitellogenic carboxypeptidase-like protein
MDVIIPYPTTENFIYKLQWYGAKEYKKAKRVIWKVGDEVAGYAREVGNFRQVMVRNAGHILPYDKPKLAFDLIQRFISGKSFDSHPSPQAE